MDENEIQMTKSINDVNNILDTAKSEDWLREYDGRPAVYKEDLLLSVALEHTDDSFDEPWATNHPDSNAKHAKAKIKYGNNVVQEVFMAVVDGGRAVLPYPEGPTDLTISQRDYNVALTLNDKDILDEYLKRSSITVK